MAIGMNFSEKQKKEIIALYESGRGLLYVAEKYYSSTGAIRAILLQNGVKMRSKGGYEINTSKELIDQIIDMYKNGYTLEKISKEVGYSDTTIRRWLKENDVPIRERVKPVVQKKIPINKAIVLGEAIDCNTQGKKCIYRVNREYKCDYCNMVGRCRGGSPHECTKYKFPEKKKRVK